MASQGWHAGGMRGSFAPMLPGGGVAVGWAQRLAWMIGDCESAIETAYRAVALNPNSFPAWNIRGHVYRVAGLPEEACGALNGPCASAR